MTNYYARFAPQYSDVTASLRKRTQRQTAMNPSCGNGSTNKKKPSTSWNELKLTQENTNHRRCQSSGIVCHSYSIHRHTRRWLCHCIRHPRSLKCWM